MMKNTITKWSVGGTTRVHLTHDDMNPEHIRIHVGVTSNGQVSSDPKAWVFLDEDQLEQLKQVLYEASYEIEKAIDRMEKARTKELAAEREALAQLAADGVVTEVPLEDEDTGRRGD